MEKNELIMGVKVKGEKIQSETMKNYCIKLLIHPDTFIVGLAFLANHPQFESAYDAQLPEDKLKSSDREQFKECNSQLKEAVENDSELRGKFDEEQLEQIENGDTPDGYTWHHDADVGKMQLVDTETHQKTGHTGGRSIWGGGTECR